MVTEIDKVQEAPGASVVPESPMVLPPGDPPDKAAPEQVVE